MEQPLIQLFLGVLGITLIGFVGLAIASYKQEHNKDNRKDKK